MRRATRQDYFSALGKGAPSCLLRLLIRERDIFEPRMDAACIGEYLRVVAASSIELVAHNLYHVTARVGLRWFDFHSIGPDDARIVRTVTPLPPEDVTAAVQRLKAIIKYYGRRADQDLALGFCMPVSAAQLERIGQVFVERSTPVAFDAEATRGETCVSLLTGMIAHAAPELGLARTNDSKTLFMALLRTHPGVELVTVYSNDDAVSHIRSPFVRLAGFVRGAPAPAKLAAIWDREFRLDPGGPAYERGAD